MPSQPLPFNPETLDEHALPELRPLVGVGGALLWRYTILFPVAEGKDDEPPSRLPGANELFDRVRDKIAEHFGGITVLPMQVGYGLRDPDDPGSLELNVNWPMLVYAAPLAASDRYFERLEEGVRGSLGQGLVLVERQDVFLLGRYYSVMQLLSGVQTLHPLAGGQIDPVSPPPPQDA